jgi:hypothetical protein
MCAKSSTGAPSRCAGRSRRRRRATQVAHPAHHLDPEGHRPALGLEALAQQAELLDHRRDRLLPGAAEQEAGMEDDHLGTACGGDAGAAVERADRRGELLPARLEVPHETEQRRVHGQRHVVGAGDLAEPLRPRVVHPEPAFEVDLARGVAALEQHLERCLRALARRDTGRADANSSHLRELYAVRRPP